MDLVEEELILMNGKFKDIEDNFQKIFTLLQNLQPTFVPAGGGRAR